MVLFNHVNVAQILLGDENPLWLTLTICAMIGPSYTLYKVMIWSSNNWAKHPIAQSLAVYCNNNTTWIAVASDINIEYRRSLFNRLIS